MRTYQDQNTVGDQNVYADAVVVRPTITANDPAGGLFQTFAAAHAAALLLPVPSRTIYIDSLNVVVPISAGAYDMDRIKIVGYPQGGGATGQQKLQSAVGATFTNWTEGCDNCILDHLGIVPLFTANVNIPNALKIRTGKNATWRSSGNTAVVVSMAGTGGLFIDVEEGSSLASDPGEFEVVGITSGEIELRAYDNSLISEDSLRGLGGTTINILYVGIGSVPTTQVNYAGTIATFMGSVNLMYTAAPAFWVAPDPNNVGLAIDRLAAAVSGLLAAPIP